MPQSRPSSSLRRAALAGIRPAVEASVAMSATVAILAAFHVSGQLLLLGAVLAMSLGRSRLSASWRGRLEALITLPVLAIVTAGVGLVLLAVPWAGALLFTGGMFLSVWLRRFGATWHRIGGLVALPLVTLLIAPAAGAREGIWGVVAASLVALAVVVLVRVVSGLSSGAQRDVSKPRSGLQRASTRMAIQLAAAVVAAFAFGFWLFPEHVGWVVLTAYLVCSGNRGRADVLHKSGLRILGAAVGTLVAVVLAGHDLVTGPSLVVLALVLVAIGQWARTLSYAWWALIVTVVLSLIQSALGAGHIEVVPRLLAILVGAACGLLASWFILPVPSLAVLRRRIADALAAFSEGTDAAPELARIDEVARPFLALARVPGARGSWRAPARWIALVHRAADALPEGELPGRIRRVLGEARRSVREPGPLEGALRSLVEALDG